MIEITDEQCRQLASGEPVNVSDPQSAQLYVVLPKDTYDRVSRLLYDSAWTDEELAQLLARSATDNGWDEPGMDDYDRYDEELRKKCP